MELKQAAQEKHQAVQKQQEKIKSFEREVNSLMVSNFDWAWPIDSQKTFHSDSNILGRAECKQTGSSKEGQFSAYTYREIESARRRYW